MPAGRDPARRPASARRRGLLVLAPLLSGLLYGLCFPPHDLFLLGWLALVPLLWAWRQVGPAGGALLGTLAGAAGASVAVRWLLVPLTHAYGFPWPLALAFFAGIALYIGLFYGALGAVVSWLHRRQTPWPLLWVPAAWVAGELARARLGPGVPWLFAGHTQGELLPLVQLAELTGVFGISFLVVAGNQALVQVRRGGGLAPVLGVALAVGGALLYGGQRLAAVTAAEGRAAPLHVAVVQPNIPQREKWDRDRFVPAMRRLYALTQEALRHAGEPPAPPPDLVVWPETALTVDLEGAAPTLAPVLRLFAGTEAQLLLGAPRVLRGPAGEHVRNSAALFGADGRRLGVYDKRHLLPFGEYYPGWLTELPGLRPLVTRHMGETEFTAGGREPLLVAKSIPFVTTICYEAAYPELIAEGIAGGGRFLVNLTNDAWFEGSAGAAQHLAMARLRTVETRTPLVRAANTGISAVVAATGRTLGRLELDEQGVLAATIHPGPAGSPYTRWGDRFAIGCAAFVPLPFFASRWRRRGSPLGQRST
ncbi:MAG: apolipoprotein N-acyltransferase [Myxococcota bacterium]|nr:apolipoprotein N-acyltransferase [Myxococcota bacterium]